MFRHRLPRLVVPSLVLVRIVLGVVFWDPVYRALTWDDFTRVALARSWAADPFISADLVWLPSQTWILGSLFKLTGSTFADNPMALVAILNTTCVILAAIVVGITAWKLTESLAGAMTALVVVLFSPWGFYTAGSGLCEPIYYLAIAVAFAGLVGFAKGGGYGPLIFGAAGVALAAGTRFDGWWLALAWAGSVMVAYRLPDMAGGRSTRLLGVAAIAAVPFLVPALWMFHSYSQTGDPFVFTTITAEYFARAYGGSMTTRGQILHYLLYYPRSFLRTDLLLFAMIVVSAWVAWGNRIARLVFLTVVCQGTVFYLAGILSKAVGGFNERFMFGFMISAAPLLGFLPAWLGRLRPQIGRALAVAAVTVWAVVTPVRWANPPIEWNHAPDLLALMSEIGQIAAPGETIDIGLDPDLAPIWATPLEVFAGDRLRVHTEPDASADLIITQLPVSPVIEDAVMVGRFQVSGPRSSELDVETLSCPCSEWVFTDETGAEMDLEENPIVWTQFRGQDPPPGSEAVVGTLIDPGVGRGAIEVRSLYGHGFNPGRIEVQVRLDGVVVERWDVAEPSRWRRVEFTAPPAGGRLEVAVVAMEGIESGWGWGGASPVLVRTVRDVKG